MREQRGTLVNGVSAEVTLSDLSLSTCASVEIINDGVVDMYATFDGSVPTIDGLGADAVKMAKIAAGESRSFDVAVTTVKVIAAGTPTYRITALGVA